MIRPVTTYLLLPADCRESSQDVVAYDSVGSGAGITGFNGGTYLIAVSDDPMTAAQEGGVVASGKITVPLCVSTFSFFVNAKPGVVLTATQTFQRTRVAQHTLLQDPSKGRTGARYGTTSGAIGPYTLRSAASAK
ncbi:unnamed protein product [Closterium sp. NIES-53]